jgi:creatine kinase
MQAIAEAEGLSDNVYLSVRVGETRRMRPFKTGETFSFSGHDGRGFVQMDAFEKLGCHVTSAFAEPTLDDVRQEMDHDVHIQTKSGIPISTKLKVEFQEQSGPAKLRHTRHKLAADAKNYFDDYDVWGTIQSMLHATLKQRPQDPLAFMREHLNKEILLRSGRQSLAEVVAPTGCNFGTPQKDDGASGPISVACGLPDLSRHCSLLADVVREQPTVYARLKDRQTINGVTLERCIRPGLDIIGDPSVPMVGVVAGDAESYEIFGELFLPIISRRHASYRLGAQHPTDLAVDKVTGRLIDPTGRYALSTQVRSCRNLHGLRLPPAFSPSERAEAELALSSALESFEDTDLCGEYLPLQGSMSYPSKPGGMTEEQMAELERHQLFKEEPISDMRVSAGLLREWPQGRGVFIAQSRKFAAWCNYEDHLQVLSTDLGGDLRRNFDRFVRAVQGVEHCLSEDKRMRHTFSRSDHLGYISTCPSNLGTGLQVSVVLRIPELQRHSAFNHIVSSFGLQAAATSDPDACKVWNRACLGISEVDLVNHVIDSCTRLIALELRLEKGEDHSDLASSLILFREAPPKYRHFARPSVGQTILCSAPSVQEPPVALDLSDRDSVLAEVLKQDPSIYGRLRNLRTALGVSLTQCTKPGLENKGQREFPGIVAGDEECYEVFRELFDGVIKLMHSSYNAHAAHPTDLNLLGLTGANVDPKGKYVISSKVQSTRNLRGFRMPPAMDDSERSEVERVVAESFMELEGEDLEGKYYPLRGSSSYPSVPGGMSEKDEAELARNEFLFTRPELPVEISAGLDRSWPQARGVYAASSRKFMVACNEEDHLRLVSTQRGPDLKEAFVRFNRAISSLSRSLTTRGHAFAWSERLGFTSVCPSKLGTGLLAGVLLRIPLLSRRSEFLRICERLQLKVRGAGEDGKQEITNSVVLGVSEVDLLNKVIIGCAKLVALEEALEDERRISLEPDFVASQQLSVLRGTATSTEQPLNRSMTLSLVGEVGSKTEETVQQAPGEVAVKGLGDEECDGFPADVCPENLPDVSRHHSVMADVLRENPSIYGLLRNKQTSLGVTFAKCIKSGIDNPGHEALKRVGVVAGDEECYDVFRELFDPIIDARHGGYAVDAMHPTNLSIGEITQARIDPEGKYAISARVRSSRSLRGLRFPPACDRQERKKAEEVLAIALSQLRHNELCGSYFPLRNSTSYAPLPTGMSEAEEQELRKYHFLFQEPESPILLCSGLGRHWPEARGIFAADSHKMVAWLNEEDHLRLISLQKGDDVRTAFERFSQAMADVEQSLDQQGYAFAHSPHLGYISSCPSNLGTGLRASVMLRIPLLADHPRFQNICRSLGLHANPMEAHCGSPAATKEGIWDVANRIRLGTSEVELVNAVIHGCAKLVNMEQALENGHDISELM